MTRGEDDDERKRFRLWAVSVKRGERRSRGDQGSRAERKALVTYQVVLLEVENVNDGLQRTKVFRRSRIDDG